MKALLSVIGALCMPLKFYITSKSHRLSNHDTKREKVSLLSGHNTVMESISDIIFDSYHSICLLSAYHIYSAACLCSGLGRMGYTNIDIISTYLLLWHFFHHLHYPRFRNRRQKLL